MKPLISVVLPTHNGEKYIKESIESVLKQTFTDWELIIVDDYSTDNTPQIVERYAANDSRIKVIHNQSNKKLPKSLNIGFESAVGEFFTWTSDDNSYMPDALKKMHEFLCENGEIYMVCAGMEIMDYAGNTVGKYMAYDKAWMFYNNCVGACFMYRRQVYEQIGGYDENLFLVEDYDYWLKIIKNYGMIGYIEESLYKYRTHNESLTMTKHKQMLENFVHLRRKNFDWMLDSLKSYLCQMYYEFVEANEDIWDIQERAISFVPELDGDRLMEDINKKVIIFGAGNYGERAASYLKDRVAYYADSNESKVGTYKLGIKVISKDELLKIYYDYYVLVCASCEKIFEIINFLYANGIKTYCTYQKFMRSRGIHSLL